MKHLYPLWACLFLLALSPLHLFGGPPSDRDVAFSLALEVVDPISCNGETDATLRGTFSGGVAPYTVAYYLYGTEVNSGTTSTEVNSVSNIPPGEYTVEATDATGATVTTSIEITEPDPLRVSDDGKVDIRCFGETTGSITVSGEGGTAPYSYLWSTGETTPTISGLDKGIYGITITDANGCTDARNFRIKGPISELGITDISGQNLTCADSPTGSATVVAKGGTGAYTYAWSNGGNTATVSNLAAGTYGVTVTDANGCTDVAQIELTSPPALVATTAIDEAITCDGNPSGAVSASGSAGTAPYTYAWSNGANTSAIDNLTAGTYTVTVTDANGCTAVSDVELVQPTSFTISAKKDADVQCNQGSDGAVSVSVDGDGSYTYLWSNGATEASLTNLTAGSYRVTVTGSGGCTASESVTVSQPSALAAVAYTDNNATCTGKADGAVSVFASRGSDADPGFTYLWSNGSTEQFNMNVPAGTYDVTVTDDNGCTITASATVTEPAGFTVETAVDANATCNGGADGAATATVVGSTGNMTYAWSNGATTATATGLAAGDYTVTVSNASGCSATQTATITEPTALSGEFGLTLDYGMNDGTAGITVTGGTGDYTYAWDTDPVQTEALATGLTTGTYTVTVTDANGCTLEQTATIGLAGDTCTMAMAIDSLLGGEADAAQYSRSFSNASYAADSIGNDELTAFFGGNDTLYHPVWFSFTGDGNIYHLRSSSCDEDGALRDTRAALFMGDCGSDTLLRASDNYAENDSMPLIEVQTEEGMRYTLLVDGADTTVGNFCLSVMQVTTLPVRTVRPATIAVFPNPTSGSLRFPSVQARTATVYDGFGRSVLQRTDVGSELDVQTLPAGVYHLRLTTTDHQVFTARVVKQ